MAKQTKKPENGTIPIEAVPHLYNQKMLAWQQAQFDALKAIHAELVKLNKEK
jgi:hypothetical protein